jgi:phosphinothricin acetyltransferase
LASTQIRLATIRDAEQIQAIYAPYCTDTIISFEMQAPSVEEMARRVEKTLSRLPWLVCESEGEVVGYAYAGIHSERAAYQWSADVSVYVSSRVHRKGVGKALYTVLFEMLIAQGYYKAFAGITLPNPASEGFHHSFGFTPVGVYQGVGYKMGAWHDVAWYQKPLQAEQLEPLTPCTLTQIDFALPKKITL